jgi:prepilin-type processing-associated H-X9-DG protein
MSVLTRMQLAWGAGVGVALAAVVAALMTPAQQPAAADPAVQLPVGLQYVPTDAAVFAHFDFAPLWKSPLGDTFRKTKVAQLDRALKEMTALSGLTLGDLLTATFYIADLKQPQDMERFGLIVTTAKAYDRDILLKALADSPDAKNGKFENKANVVRISSKDARRSLFVDLSDDKRMAFGINLKDEPKADPRRDDGPHSPLLKQAPGAAMVGGVNFANLPDEIRRDDQNFPPQMRAFLPIFKAETLSLVAKMTGKELSLSLAVRTPNKQLAGDVEKSLDILRGLAKVGLDEGEKAIKQAEKDGDDLKDLRPLLKVAGDVLKTGKLDVDDRTATATLTVPTDVPYGAFVELVSGGKVTSNASNQNNLKQLGLAMHNYHDANGALFPSYLVDKKGKPTLSWRVLALPYVEQENLYKKFKLDEPWDSEHNLKVYKDNPMPQVYLNTGDKAEDKTTRYRVFTGNGAGFDATGRLKITDMADGTSNTIAIVTAATAVPWTKPDELEFDPEKEVVKLLHFKGDRCNVAFFDGSVRSLSPKTTDITLKAAITRAGGEVFSLDK